MENETMIVNLQDVNVVDTPMFEEYTSFKEDLDREITSVPFPHTYLPPEIKARNEAIADNINKLSPSTLKQRADALIKQQELSSHNALLEHMASKSGDYPVFSAMWSPILWQSRETSEKTTVQVNGIAMEAFDLDYLIAENLQQLYASKDPRAEYHDWVEQQRQIETDLNTDGATEEEIATRNSFISFLDDRETEMKRVIFLYAGAAFNSNSRQQKAAQEKLKFLTFKLSELRRLRERTQSTKSHADNKEYLEEQERRQQQFAVAVTNGLISAEMLSVSAQTAKTPQEKSFDLGIVETLMRTQQTPSHKIEETMQRAVNMKAMFEAMRNGKSKEQWLKENSQNTTADTLRSKLRKLRGFNISKYQQLLEQEHLA